MSERYLAVELVLQEGANLSVIATRFGISRKTLYKWIGQHKAGGQQALMQFD